MGERGWSQLRAGYWKLMLLPGKTDPWDAASWTLKDGRAAPFQKCFDPGLQYA